MPPVSDKSANLHTIMHQRAWHVVTISRPGNGFLDVVRILCIFLEKFGTCGRINWECGVRQCTKQGSRITALRNLLIV